MPGWDSLETVTRIHDAAQITGLVLLALLLAGAVVLALQFRRSAWPEWIDVGSYQVRSLVCAIAAAVVLTLLAVSVLVAYGYGTRQSTLVAAAEQPHADRLRHMGSEGKARQADEVKIGQSDETAVRQADEAKVRDKEEANARRTAENPRELTSLRLKLTETENQLDELKRKLSEAENQRVEQQRKLSAAENQLADLRGKPAETESQLASLRRKLSETENQLAELQRKQMHKRLSEDEKKLLIEALKPFAGQKVAVASRLGDEDGKTLAQDFVAVLGAAGWNLGGDAGLSVQRWDRDPVGIEIALNETDARAGRVSSGIGALINAVRKLGLSYDNTIYMNREVPSGQVLVKVGRKLPKP